MITANDIREVKFTRTMGGYRTTEVDDFLDHCADAVEELTKENTENSRKLQVLADSVVDYRNQEDSIRSALIGAQRMSESVIADARKQAEEIIAAAKEEAANLKQQAMADASAEQAELARVKKEVASFKSRLMSIYREHLTLIGVLEGAEDEQPAPEAPAVKKEEPMFVKEEVPAVKPAVEPLTPATFTSSVPKQEAPQHEAPAPQQDAITPFDLRPASYPVDSLDISAFRLSDDE